MEQQIKKVAQEFWQQFPSSVAKDAVEYSLYNFGKLIRARLYQAVCQDLGIPVNYHVALAIEMIHCYSLIHDDLPGMDNAQLRRGKPTNHLVFGEAQAILAGDSLLTHAFEVLYQGHLGNCERSMVQAIISASGLRGMILGQSYDIQGTKDSGVELEEINHYKTGKLLILCGEVALIQADQLSLLPQVTALLTAFGKYFQLQDDLLSYLQDSQTIGKDSQNDENKFPQLYGVAATEARLQALMEEMQGYLDTLSFTHTKELLMGMVNRSC